MPILSDELPFSKVDNALVRPLLTQVWKPLNWNREYALNQYEVL